MNLTNAYYHGINPTSETNVDFANLTASLKVLNRIIRCKHIYSLHYQGERQREGASIADIDKVCLCKDMRSKINGKSNPFDCQYDAYSMYVLYRYSIILSAKMQGVYKPKLLASSAIRAMYGKNYDSTNYKALLDNNCTDLFDEYRTYMYISLKEDAIAIGAPFFSTYAYLLKHNSKKIASCPDKFAAHLENIKKTLVKAKLDMPIVDTELKMPIDKIDNEFVSTMNEQAQKRRILVNL